MIKAAILGMNVFSIQESRAVMYIAVKSERYYCLYPGLRSKMAKAISTNFSKNTFFHFFSNMNFDINKANKLFKICGGNWPSDADLPSLDYTFQINQSLFILRLFDRMIYIFFSKHKT